MNGFVLILHGFPQSLNNNHVIYRYFKKRGYTIVKPNLFDEKFSFVNGKYIEEIEKPFKGSKPDVIVAYSFGGLLAPHIAKRYPDAKLVLIATGPSLNISFGLFGLIYQLARIKVILYLFNVFKYLPKKIQFFIYQLILPFRGNRSEFAEYEEDMKSNVESLITIPFDKQVDLINFINKTNNTSILKTLRNKTLIFAGENDLLMPLVLSQELYHLVKGSALRVSRGEHFDVFTEDDYRELDEFLK